MGRGTKPPPQFGHTFWSLVSTQSSQNVHSYEQMRASVALGGKSLSQYSQFGRSCSAIAASIAVSIGSCNHPISAHHAGNGPHARWVAGRASIESCQRFKLG